MLAKCVICMPCNTNLEHIYSKIRFTCVFMDIYLCLGYKCTCSANHEHIQLQSYNK